MLESCLAATTAPFRDWLAMAENSSIEWTDATWNPVTGCTKISAGCDNCYAARFSERFRGVPGHPFETGFDLTLRPERLLQPFAWKRPRMIFVNSMSDLFHKDIPRAHIAAVFNTMEKADWHIYQVLTKRSSLLQKFINDRYKHRTAPAHMWFGVSVEHEQAPRGSCICRRPAPASASYP
jgi:protein gp37